MKLATRFLCLAVENLLGPVAVENSQSTQLELTVPANPDLKYTLQASAGPDGTVKVEINGNPDATQSAPRNEFYSLALAVASGLPDELQDAGLVIARLQGTDAKGDPMTPGIGNSQQHCIVKVTPTSAALATDGAVAAEPSILGIMTAALNTAIDYIESGEGRYARVKIDDGRGLAGLTWLLISPDEQHGIYCRTNDIDLMVPCGPSFEAIAGPAEVKALALDYLQKTYANAVAVTVHVFREESRTGVKPLLEGSSLTGQLTADSEKPSL